MMKAMGVISARWRQCFRFPSLLFWLGIQPGKTCSRYILKYFWGEVVGPTWSDIQCQIESSACLTLWLTGDRLSQYINTRDCFHAGRRTRLRWTLLFWRQLITVHSICVVSDGNLDFYSASVYITVWYSAKSSECVSAK